MDFIKRLSGMAAGGMALAAAAGSAGAQESKPEEPTKTEERPPQEIQVSDAEDTRNEWEKFCDANPDFRHCPGNEDSGPGGQPN